MKAIEMAREMRCSARDEPDVLGSRPGVPRDQFEFVARITNAICVYQPANAPDIAPLIRATLAAPIVIGSNAIIKRDLASKTVK